MAQTLVVARRFHFFVTEIFDGLIINNGIDRLGIGFGIQFIHGASEMGAPFRD